MDVVEDEGDEGFGARRVFEPVEGVVDADFLVVFLTHPVGDGVEEEGLAPAGRADEGDEVVASAGKIFASTDGGVVVGEGLDTVESTSAGIGKGIGQASSLSGLDVLSLALPYPCLPC